MKNILIITYYWPPTGGVGTQRWLKLSKYLIRNKLKPIIYTPSNPTSPIKDLSTIDDIEKGVEVIKKDIFEPNKFFQFSIQVIRHLIFLLKDQQVFGEKF